LASILQRDSIPDSTFQAFKARLIALKFIEVAVTPDYVAFVYDGMLNNENGYLLLASGHRLPALGTEFLGVELILLEEVAPGWYYFATT
jgi:hypothetical protein